MHAELVPAGARIPCGEIASAQGVQQSLRRALRDVQAPGDVADIDVFLAHEAFEHIERVENALYIVIDWV